MLVELRIKDFAIIEQVHLEFRQGLNIISGETGAGKSVIVRSLGLLMGAKSQTSDVRTGADLAVVEGHFDIQDRTDIQKGLSHFGISFDEPQLLVRRLISREGKNRVYINGHLCTLTDLKNVIAPMVEVTGFSTPLIEMTGQHDNKHLLSSQYHLDLLDQFCQVSQLKSQVAQTVQLTKEIDEKVSQLQGSSMDRSQRLDFIQYQIKEIENLAINIEKDSHLESRIQSLKSVGALSQFYENLQHTLDTTIGPSVHRLLQESKGIKSPSKNIQDISEALQNVQTLLEDISYTVTTGEPDETEEDLDSLQHRLSQIRKLQRKFGQSLEDIEKAYQEMKQEQFELENSEEEIAKLKLQKKALLNEIQPVVEKLHKKRSKGSEKLEKRINQQLLELNMKGVTFHIQITKLETLASHGQDKVLFAIQNGKMDEPRAIHKTASGGELSRILLSLKTAINFIDLPRTYLFDEVDTGVSGPTAEKVGRKLKSIADGQQVLCITHLPQVAACGDEHYLIAKEEHKGFIKMSAERLTTKDRIKEVARLISGEKVTKTSLEHASALINS